MDQPCARLVSQLISARQLTDAAMLQGGPLMAAHLRVFASTDESTFCDGGAATVRVRLADLLPLVALAQRNNYQWLQDFLDDEVCITNDLYEVMRAFRCYRPSA
jgi:hypothetical protein